MTAARRIALTMILLCLLTAVGGTADAQADRLQVSRDGQRWSTELDQPLFDGARQWVPGDTDTVTVWARNTSTDLAGLTVRALGAGVGPGIDDHLQLEAMVDGRPLGTGPEAGGYPVRPGDQVRMDVTVVFPRAAGNSSQRLRTDVTLRVTLAQLSGAVEPGPSNAATWTAPEVLLLGGPLLLASCAHLLATYRRPRPTPGAR